MNEKKVANIHTKPRGKGQCSPEQTCPEVPLVLYQFFTLIDGRKKENINISNQKYLPVFTCFYLFCCIFYYFYVGNCSNSDWLISYSMKGDGFTRVFIHVSL